MRKSLMDKIDFMVYCAVYFPAWATPPCNGRFKGVQRQRSWRWGTSKSPHVFGYFSHEKYHAVGMVQINNI